MCNRDGILSPKVSRTPNRLLYPDSLGQSLMLWCLCISLPKSFPCLCNTPLKVLCHQLDCEHSMEETGSYLFERPLWSELGRWSIMLAEHAAKLVNEWMNRKAFQQACLESNLWLHFFFVRSPSLEESTQLFLLAFSQWAYFCNPSLGSHLSDQVLIALLSNSAHKVKVRLELWPSLSHPAFCSSSALGGFWHFLMYNQQQK